MFCGHAMVWYECVHRLAREKAREDMREAMRRDRNRARIADDASPVMFQVYAGPYPGPRAVAPTPPRPAAPVISPSQEAITPATLPSDDSPTVSTRRRPTPDSRSPAIATDWHNLNIPRQDTTLDATVFSGLNVRTQMRVCVCVCVYGSTMFPSLYALCVMFCSCLILIRFSKLVIHCFVQRSHPLPHMTRGHSTTLIQVRQCVLILHELEYNACVCLSDDDMPCTCPPEALPWRRYSDTPDALTAIVTEVQAARPYVKNDALKRSPPSSTHHDEASTLARAGAITIAGLPLVTQDARVSDALSLAVGADSSAASAHHKVEALRMHLEQELGFKTLVAAHRAMQRKGEPGVSDAEVDEAVLAIVGYQHVGAIQVLDQLVHAENTLI